MDFLAKIEDLRQSSADALFKKLYDLFHSITKMDGDEVSAAVQTIAVLIDTNVIREQDAAVQSIINALCDRRDNLFVQRYGGLGVRILASRR